MIILIECEPENIIILLYITRAIVLLLIFLIKKKIISQTKALPGNVSLPHVSELVETQSADKVILDNI